MRGAVSLEPSRRRSSLSENSVGLLPLLDLRCCIQIQDIIAQGASHRLPITHIVGAVCLA